MWPVWGWLVSAGLREVVEEVEARDRVEHAALRIYNLHSIRRRESSAA